MRRTPILCFLSGKTKQLRTRKTEPLRAYATQIRQITSLIAGEFGTDVRVTTQDNKTVGIIRLGNILVEIEDAAAALRVCEFWTDARVQAELIADKITPEWILKRYPAEASISAQVRLIGAPAVTSTYMERVRHDLKPVPAHVRFSLGPLVWHIFDQLAWQQFGRSWQELADRMS
jgi:hypothetical protein